MTVLPANADAAASQTKTPWFGYSSSGKSAVSVVAAGSVIVAAIVTWRQVEDAALVMLPLTWTLAPLLVLHLLQILLATAAWSGLLAGDRHPVPLSFLFRFRVIREGVDSMLPIAQVGGEIVASAALMRCGVRPALAVGGIIVDMIAEVLGQFAYLILGCLLLSASSPQSAWPIWLFLVGTALFIGVALFASNQFGVLRLVEQVLPRIARHVSDVPCQGMSGLQETVMRLFGDVRATGTAVLLHALHWAVGAVEVWIVLRAMGLPIGPGQAIVTNAVGLAARSAGIAIPGSLGVQESGFVLGAALAGMPPQAALVFSLLRRLRELSIGVVAVALWQWDRSAANAVPCTGMEADPAAAKTI